MARKKSLSVVDRELLGILKQDGRIKWTELARRIGLSRVAVQNRVSALERSGWISGYTVRLAEPLAKRTGVQAFLRIRFSPGNNCFAMFQKYGADGIVEGAWSLAGDWDAKLLLHAQTMEEVSAFRELIALGEGIDEIETEVVMNDLTEPDP